MMVTMVAMTPEEEIVEELITALQNYKLGLADQEPPVIELIKTIMKFKLKGKDPEAAFKEGLEEEKRMKKFQEVEKLSTFTDLN